MEDIIEDVFHYLLFKFSIHFNILKISRLIYLLFEVIENR